MTPARMPCCGAPILPRPFQCLHEWTATPGTPRAWTAARWFEDGRSPAADMQAPRVYPGAQMPLW
jgi:hypothetical protein